MHVVDFPLHQIREAPWNPNRMDEGMMARLRKSIQRYGVVENLVVRPLGDGIYEVLSGNQRLKVLMELGVETAPCVVVELDDAQARLLAQALNRIQGEDNLGLRAEAVRTILTSIPEADLLGLLPETAASLTALASMGQQTMSEYLENWQQAQAARLRHLQFQLTPEQLDVVDKALTALLPQARQQQGDSPNARGVALYLLCKRYLESEVLP
ncbi:MAG: chromosome partitioning protein ParB [Chloroflexi bacterium]|nr:MAG: chromosome partitioning protein ParB [Chloroflexota bacterium]